MALTGLQVYLDPPANDLRGTTLPFDGIIEYSRNEPGREVVTLRVIPTPNDGTLSGEQITVRLMKARRDRMEEVVQAKVVFDFTGPVDPIGRAFSFDLRQVVYDPLKPFPVVRHGNYYFQVERTTPASPAVEGITDDFRVAVMTTDALEENWLLGATRRSNDDRSVRQQPSQITGVQVKEVSRNHPLDLFPLSLVYDKDDGVAGGGGPKPVRNVYLSWDDGELVKLETSIPTGIQKQYALPNRQRKDYVIVQVDPRYLPNTDTTEFLLIDRQLVKRQQLRDWLDAEVQWIEEVFLHVPVDPGVVVSDFSLRTLSPGSGTNSTAPILPENSDYDFKSSPASYYPPNAGHWINLRVPFWRPLHWDYLEGALETTRIVSVNTDWIHHGTAGFIELLPFNQSFAYHFIGLMYVHAVRGPVGLPSFWRYRYWAGIPDDTVPKTILDIIGMRVAVKGLAVLGQAFRGGFSSQSVSRDGVSESVGYTASAMYGIYSATIEEYKKRLEPLEKQVKGKYFGIFFMAL